MNLWIGSVDVVDGNGRVDDGNCVRYGEESYDVELIKIWNWGISFQPLALIVNDAGLDSVVRMTGVTGVTIQGMTGYNSSGSSCRKIMPELETVVRICMGLGCSFGDVVRFTGYEVLGRYETPAPRRFRKGALSYAPLRGLLYDEYGKDWKKGLNRLLSFIAPRVPPKQRGSSKFEIKSDESYAANWRDRLRGKLLKDKSIAMVELYDLCRILNCQVDNVIEIR